MDTSPTSLLQSTLDRITFAVVDVETTGLNPYMGHRLCEIAIVLQRGDQEIEAFVRRVNPERPIDPRAQAVHGISDEELRDAPRFAEIAATVRDYLEDAVIVGHNVLFDVEFLATEWRRLHWPPPRAHLVDTLALARRWLELPSNRLVSLASTLDISTDAAHSALGDARITAQVLYALTRMLRSHSVTTLGDLINAQGGFISWPQTPWGNLPSILQHALMNKYELWLRYINKDGIVTERRVVPLDASDKYLIAYCHLRQAQRSFRIDRILEMWF